GRDVLLALELNGRPLSAERGAPLRLVVPGYYGYKSVKWVRRVSLAATLEPGYWELRGYDADARIRD
ncbi:MAG TPA: molybdopterin-dependent oxidoreductase, partial [Methylomirabilota bacterium]|nr:molybdopterin-dependent oxidoreductase [Methylomirabilota bacterium]